MLSDNYEIGLHCLLGLVVFVSQAAAQAHAPQFWDSQVGCCFRWRDMMSKVKSHASAVSPCLAVPDLLS